MNRLKSRYQNKLSLLLTTAVIAALFGLALIITSVPQDATAQTPELTDNEIAANGPMPGDLSKVDEEWECSQDLDTPGYFKSLNGAEVADSTRSMLYPCASFLGSMTGPNQVFAYRFPDSYQGVLFMNNRRPGELYLTGGNLPPASGPIPPGPYVAKVDATTGKEMWRTYLENGNVSGNWIGAANLNILPDGNIPIAFGNTLVKLDGDTGRILQRVDLPTGEAPPLGSNHKHLTIAPDGTLILKNQTRATPCNIQGTLAAFQCPGGTDASPGSNIAAVNPDTFEIYDNINVPENAVSPHSITTFQGRIAIYVTTVGKFYRFFWDPETKKLSQDTSWVVSPLEPGQTAGDAPGILGDWVVIQVNGLPANVASSIVAISQSDPTKITSVYPFGTDLPTGQSWAPPKAAIDSENSMVYSADQNMGQIAGIKFDQDSGEMTTVWTLDAATTALQGLYGPKEQRVLGTARAEPGTTLDQLNNTSNPTYQQQVLWLNAATGEILAESSFFEPMNFNTLLTPGFGGRFYYMWGDGIIVFQVMPARDEPPGAPASAATGSADEDDSAAAAASPDKTVSAQNYSDTRNQRYCELVLNYDDRADIYNSTGLSECPDDQWENLDLDAIAQAYGANSVDPNGPQYWMTDTLVLYGAEPTDMGGIMMRFGATLPPPPPGGSSDPPPYTVFSPTKTQYNEYDAGSEVYELVDPDGNVYVLQARKDTVSLDSLETLGDQMTGLPEGWVFRTRILDEDLVFDMTPDVAIPSTADEFGQIYVRILE